MNNSDVGDNKTLNELYSSAEKANYPKLVKILESCFSATVIDCALRKCIRNSSREKKEYHDSIKLILEGVNDINFQSIKDDNSTILHCACLHKDPYIVDIIISFGLSKDKNRIDVNAKDSKGNTVLHYLLKEKHNNEGEVEEIMRRLFNEEVDVNQENIEGVTPLSLALSYGYAKFSQLLIAQGAKKSHINRLTLDNLLHCAVIGMNINCVELVIELDKRHKNKKGLTPIDLAAQNPELSKILQHLQTYGDTTDVDTKIISLIKPLEEFKNRNYKSSLELLNKIKKTKNEVNQNLEWNIFLNKYYLLQNEGEDYNRTEKKSNNSKQVCIFKGFTDFFCGLDKNADSFKIDNFILVFNKGLAYFKMSEYSKSFEILHEYLIKSGNNYEWMMYLNTAFIFTEMCINIKQTKATEAILIKIDEFLISTFINNKYKRNEVLKDVLCDYLNSREIINKFTPGDELFSILNLFKAYKSLHENKFEEVRKNFDEYKRLILYCKYKESLPIFNTLRYFYKFLKIKLVYHQNIQTKYNKYLKSLHFDIQRNPRDNFNSKVYYFNTLGIVNLKHKKFSLAEYYFKSCIELLKVCLKNMDFLTRPNFVYYAKFNLGLCYFHQKQYSKAYVEFKAVSNKLNYYPYVWYRLGLCCIEIEFASLRQQRKESSYNDLIQSAQGFRFTDDTKDTKEPTQSQNKKVILRNLTVNDQLANYTNKISEAINFFKQALSMLKDNVVYRKEIRDIMMYYGSNFGDAKNQGLTSIVAGNYGSNIVISTYLNLIFCLILREDWIESLFYLSEVENSEYFNKDNHFIIDNYKIECLLNLNRINEALDIVKAAISSSSNLSYCNSENKGSFYTKFNSGYNEVSYKLAFFVNVVKLHIINNNWSEVERSIYTIYSLLGINSTSGNYNNVHDLPPFILNILVYYYIRKEYINSAIQLIRTRRIPPNFSSHNTQGNAHSSGHNQQQHKFK